MNSKEARYIHCKEGEMEGKTIKIPFPKDNENESLTMMEEEKYIRGW